MRISTVNLLIAFGAHSHAQVMPLHTLRGAMMPGKLSQPVIPTRTSQRTLPHPQFMPDASATPSATYRRVSATKKDDWPPRSPSRRSSPTVSLLSSPSLHSKSSVLLQDSPPSTGDVPLHFPLGTSPFQVLNLNLSTSTSGVIIANDISQKNMAVATKDPIMNDPAAQLNQLMLEAAWGMPDPIVQRQMPMLGAITQTKDMPEAVIGLGRDPKSKLMLGEMKQDQGLLIPSRSIQNAKQGLNKKKSDPGFLKEATALVATPGTRQTDEKKGQRGNQVPGVSDATVPAPNMLELGVKNAIVKAKEFMFQNKDKLRAVRRMIMSDKAALYCVPFLWAAHGPIMRGIYSLSQAPAPSVLMLARALVITGMYAVTEKLQKLRQSTRKDGQKGTKLAFDGKVMTMYAVILGVVNFLCGAAHTDALQHLSATRSGFIVSIKTVLVPMIAAIEGQFIPSTRNWITSFMALAGTSSLVLAKGGSQGLLGSLSFGDFEMLFAAFNYALFTVIYGKALKVLPAAELLTRKNLVYSGLCALWVACDFVKGTVSLWPNSWTDPNVWAGILGTSVLTGWLAGIFQAKAQTTISPQDAEVAYALTPVCTALLGIMLLQEKLSLLEAAGASMIVAATFVASSKGKRQDKELKASPK